MAFRGETAQIPLTNIFQTLSLSSQRGVLEITWRDTQRRFRFLGGGVRVLPNHPGDAEPLRSTLVKQQILTEAQFTNVLESLPPQVPLGDALLDRRVRTREQVGGSLRSQFEELLLTAFTWTDALFNFTAGEGSDAEQGVVRDGVGCVGRECRRHQGVAAEMVMDFQATVKILIRVGGPC